MLEVGAILGKIVEGEKYILIHEQHKGENLIKKGQL